MGAMIEYGPSLVPEVNCPLRLPHAMVESLALQEFHDDEGLPLGFIDIVHRADPRILQRRGSVSLTLEALERRVVVEVISWDKLHRDGTAQADIITLVNDTHAAAQPLTNAANETILPVMLVTRACGSRKSS